jgi:Flp pilus assembly protein CpaB
MEFAQRLVTSKRGSFMLAILAALAAGVLVLVYVKRYRDSVAAQSAPVTVLIAKSTIPKGTPGQIVASEGLYTVSTVRQSQLLEGAVSDPSSLVGHSAAEEIFPGQQLTVGDFSAPATSVASTLTAHQRVVSVPLDAAHGATPDLSVGDHVDVYAGFNVTPIGPNGVPLTGGQSRPVLKLVMQDIPVVGIKTSGGGVGGAGGSNISLKVGDVQAAELAFATDNGKLWLAVRPAVGAAPSRPTLVTAETMLLGVRPVAVERALGGGGR